MTNHFGMETLDMFAVLFDLEGTLVRSIEDDKLAIREFKVKTMEKLVELGIPYDELKNTSTSTLMRNKAIEFIEKHSNEAKAGLFQLEMDRFLKRYELDWANRSRIFSDTLPALRKLKRLDLKMGVVTNTSREAASCMLSLHSIEAFFQVVVTRDDVRKLKPDPGSILLALKKLHAKNFCFVGDLVHDLQATKKAGGISITINRNPSKKLEFVSDYVVRSLTEIPDIVQQLNKAT